MLPCYFLCHAALMALTSISNPTSMCKHQFNSSQTIPLADYIRQNSEQLHIPYSFSNHQDWDPSGETATFKVSIYSDVYSQLDPLLQCMHGWFDKCEILRLPCDLLLFLSRYRVFISISNSSEMHCVSAITGSCRMCLVTVCVIGTSCSINHSMIFCHGWLTFVQHNELRDLAITWLWDVCHGNLIELPLHAATLFWSCHTSYCQWMWWS